MKTLLITLFLFFFLPPAFAQSVQAPCTVLDSLTIYQKTPVGNQLRLVLTPEGNVGVGVAFPFSGSVPSRLTVCGDVEIKGEFGLILQSPNGERWRVYVNNAGMLEQKQLP